MGPSDKADAGLGLNAPSLSLVLQRKRGRKKGKRKCPIYMLSGIAFRGGSLADGSVIRSRLGSHWPLPDRRSATPQAACLGRSGGTRQLVSVTWRAWVPRRAGSRFREDLTSSWTTVSEPVSKLLCSILIAHKKRGESALSDERMSMQRMTISSSMTRKGYLSSPE